MSQKPLPPLTPVSHPIFSSTREVQSSSQKSLPPLIPVSHPIFSSTREVQSSSQKSVPPFSPVPQPVFSSLREKQSLSQKPLLPFSPVPKPICSLTREVQTPSSSQTSSVRTPKSNFTLSPPALSSSSSDDDDDNSSIDQASSQERLSRITARTSSSGSVFGDHESIHGSILRRQRLRMECRTEADEIVESNDTILAVVFASGKLGAAYYNVGTSQLHLLPDIAESAPDFLILRSLYYQIMPKYIIASIKQDDRMLRMLKSLCGDLLQDESESESELNDQNRDANLKTTQLIILSGKDFAPDLCRRRLQSLILPYEPLGNDTEAHLQFMASVIPFGNEIMIRAAGALLKYLDVSGISLLQIELLDGQVPVLDVCLTSMTDLVMIDQSVWSSLQIFNLDIHPSSTKIGTSSGSKEGLSVYSWLNKCSSAPGSKFLRMMLLRPTRDAKVLKRRYDVIEFCSLPARIDFVKAAMDCLKVIKSFPKLLSKLSLLHASSKEWKEFYQTTYHCLLLAQLCKAHLSSDIDLFREISTPSYLKVLKDLSQELLRVINFEESKTLGRLVAKIGIDPELDKKKRRFAGLPDVMSMVAAEEMKSLPESAIQCSIVYLPEIGFLLCVTFSEDVQILNGVPPIFRLDFMFVNNGMAYYRSPRTKELDIVVGDCQVDILEKETSIMIVLTNAVLKNYSHLTKIGELVAELDCLISIARVAADNKYVRPVIVDSHENLVIKNGRHPLLEHMCDYVPNNTTISKDNRVIILTGPNASGKSIYMKQVGSIVLMALCGIFVPAVSVKVPTFDRICSRIHAVESVSTGMSSFMLDINQMSSALRTCTRNSLVLIDEFGKGTNEVDGLSLLSASVRDFLRKKENCPTVFLCTHFCSLVDYLEPSTPYKLLTMQYMKDENQIVYLFKLIDGVSRSSFANLVAGEAGISTEILLRSDEIEQVVRKQDGESVDIIPVNNNRKSRENLMISMATQYLSMDLDAINPHDFFHGINCEFDSASDSEEEDN